MWNVVCLQITRCLFLKTLKIHRFQKLRLQSRFPCIPRSWLFCLSLSLYDLLKRHPRPPLIQKAWYHYLGYILLILASYNDDEDDDLMIQAVRNSQDWCYFPNWKATVLTYKPTIAPHYWTQVVILAIITKLESNAMFFGGWSDGLQHIYMAP